MSFNPIKCSSQANFNKICKNLVKLGAKGHEVIKIKQNYGGSFIPKTCPKSKWYYRIVEWIYKPKNVRIKNVAEFIESFFKKNEKFALKQDTVLYQLRPIIRKGNDPLQINFFNGLIQRINDAKNKKLKETAVKLKKIALNNLEEAKKKAVEIVKKAEKEAEEVEETVRKDVEQLKELAKDLQAELEAKRKKGFEEIDCDLKRGKNKANKGLEVLKRRNLEEQTRLDSMKDVIIYCKNGEKTLSVHELMDIEYFNNDTFKDKMQKVNVKAEDKENYSNLKYAYNFPDYSKDTVQAFVNYIFDEKTISDVTDSDTLLELYSLADFICWDQLKKAIADQFVNAELSVEDSLKLLVSFPLRSFPPEDLICQKLLMVIGINWRKAVKTEAFLKLDEQHIKFLLKSDWIFESDELEVLDNIVDWSISQSTYPDKEIIELIRFSRIDRHSFADWQRKRDNMKCTHLVDSVDIEAARGIIINEEKGKVKIIYSMPKDIKSNEIRESKEISFEGNQFTLTCKKYYKNSPFYTLFIYDRVVDWHEERISIGLDVKNFANVRPMKMVAFLHGIFVDRSIDSGGFSKIGSIKDSEFIRDFDKFAVAEVTISNLES